MQDLTSESHPDKSSHNGFEAELSGLDEVASMNTSFITQCTTEEKTYGIDDRESTSCVTGILKPEHINDTCNEDKWSGETSGEDHELQVQEEELELLKEAVRMVLDSDHSEDFYIEQLNKQIEAKRCSLQELENQWEVSKKPLEETRWNLLESLCAESPSGQIKLQKLKEINIEMQSVCSEIRKREEECVKLARDLENQPKAEPRRSYIQRITEITKNSRKLDADIERILKETRELKLESNSIEERLHRTYTVVDEMVFREAKKDYVGRQAYQLLTSIHECFEEICEKIRATDKAQREVAELQAKLSVIASQNLDIKKLQADLDAIRMENEQLENILQNH